MTQTDKEQINAKLDHIQREIDSMQSQIDSIRVLIADDKPQTQLKPNIQKETVHRDYEKIFGKSWMGAIASVLIFVSIIMFAALLIPYLTDALKMTVMFAVSIAITAFGLLKLRTDTKSHFYLSLAGCGIGAVYISLLMSNIYFKMVNDLGLFLLILVWAVLVCLVNRNNSVLFHVIGQLGISIAIISGTHLCVNTMDDTKFLLLVVFFAVSSLLFFLSNIRQTPNYKTIDHAFNIFNLSVLIYGYVLLDDYAFAGIIAAVYIAGMLCALIMQSKNNISFGILASLYGIEALTFSLMTCRGYGVVMDILGVLIGIVMLCIAEYKIRKPHDAGRCIIQIVFIFIISVLATDISVNAEYYVYIVLAFIFMIFGFVRNDFVYKYAGICNIACAVFGDAYENALLAILILGFFAVLFYLLVRLKQQYSCPLKIISYVVFIFALIRALWLFEDGIGSQLRITGIFTVITFLNIIVIKTIGTINLKTSENEKSSMIVLNIINLVMMVSGLFVIIFLRDSLCLVIMIITALAAFSVNSLNLMRRYDKNIAAGIYVGIKYTWFLATILTTINCPKVIISIACLILAVICILIGFKLLIKSIRIYGLALSILSVVKLSLLDINYGNLAGRAAGFFICGVLCFSISMVYNMIDKKMRQDVEK